MVTRHFDLVFGLFRAPRAPKRARFGPERAFWGSQRDSEGPRGPDLVPVFYLIKLHRFPSKNKPEFDERFKDLQNFLEYL